MNDQLLYYPYISLPESTWTTRSILYWDNVGAIVPNVYPERPNRFEQYMLDLVRAELVEQVFPYNYVHLARNFDEAFLRLTQQRNFDLDERRAAFRRGEHFQLHIQKIGERLIHELVEMGIARQKRNSWEWYYVESKTAKLFMMYLASVIGKAGGYTPATNSASNVDLSVHQNGLSYYSQRMRGRFLNDLMPYPINPDPIKLKKFKEKNQTQLKHFRILLEGSVLHISGINNGSVRNQSYDLKKAEILHCKEEIAAKLNESRFGQITFGTIFGLAGAATAFAADQKAVGLISLANAVYSSFQGYDRPELSREYAYLALIERDLRTRA
jgi:hypothetical protein